MQELLTALQEIESPGAFCAFGTIEPCFLGLNVDKVGTVGLPLTDYQAQQIIAQCHQAPFGQGEKTVVDTDVRRVFELEPEHFSIDNPEWNTRLKTVVEEAKAELGLADSPVKHELYKMLLYQEGDFFVPHRDTEKMDNMFATLVVVLPSAHQGGELIINHEGRCKRFASGGHQSPYSMSYAAFYADCQHEVKPVTEGYRLCLIYNLALENVSKQPAAPQNGSVVQRVAEVLQRWQEQDEEDKLVLTLGHRYSEKGLSFQTLKNFDKAQANILLQAAEEAGCKVHLGLLTLWQSGSVEYGGYYYDDDDAEMEEVFDENLYIDYWVDRNGAELELGEVQIEEDELIGEHSIYEIEADSQEIEEATGNAGATMERWYHRAAIVIWRERQHFSILAGIGQKQAATQLELMLNNASEPKSIARCKAFAEEIIRLWYFADPDRFVVADEADRTTEKMLSILARLADEKLLKKFLTQVLVLDFSGLEGLELAHLCQRYGWSSFEEPLLKMSSVKELNKITRFSQILLSLLVFNTENQQERHELCQKLAHNLVESIQKLPAIGSKSSWRVDMDNEPKKVLLETTFKALHELADQNLLGNFCQHIVSAHKKFDIYVEIIPVLEKLQVWQKAQNIRSPSYKKFLADCSHRIGKAAAKIIEEPSDWLIDAQVPCSCADCADLNAFLKDAGAQVHRFRVRKDRRQHLHRQIDSNKLEIDHVTERKGSPQTLVCTKNRKSYHDALAQKELDIRLLADLRKMQQELS